MPRQSHSEDIFNNDETDSQLSTNYNTSDEDESYATTKSPTKKSLRNLPPSRNAANARERARMRVLARAFCRLKTTLPWVPADTKLSKLDTLRLATSYIAYLREVLMLDEEKQMEIQRERDGGIKKHPVTMSWPFNFGTTSTTSTADRFTNMSITSNHLKPASLNSKNLPDCRSIILNSTNDQQIKTSSNMSLRASDSWEVGNGSDNEFPAGIADQNQLMSCQQRGDKDIEVLYY